MRMLIYCSVTKLLMTENLGPCYSFANDIRLTNFSLNYTKLVL